MQSFEFECCTVMFWSDRVETRFWDGYTVFTRPPNTACYQQLTCELGYGRDSMALCRAQELCYSLLAEAEGFDYNRALHQVALGKPRDPAEERRVLAMLRWLHGGPLPKFIRQWPDQGKYLRTRACECGLMRV
jgi:hypothetical protein